ncbi:MAG: CHAT domain-containing protein [Gemmatimonadota bacterium]
MGALADTSARTLWLRAIEAESHFQTERAVILYERAVRRDPLNFEYQHHYESALSGELGPIEARARVTRLLAGDSRTCRTLADRGALKALAARWRKSAARTCIAHHAFGAVSGELKDSFAAELERVGLPTHYPARAAQLARESRHEEAIALLRRGLRRVVHPRDRIMIAIALAGQLRSRHRQAEAAQIERDLVIAVERGAPAATYWYALWKIPGSSRDSVDAITLGAARTAQRHGAWGLCANILYLGGWLHVNRGDPARAIRLLDDGLSCAGRSVPYYRMLVAVQLGRAFSKAGQYDAAIATLTRAVPIARSTGAPYYLADALHNLAHAYEGKGDWARARSSADAYVGAASKLERASLRIVSLRDAGIIYWNSYQRAAARRYFDRMAGLIVDEQHEFHWAAEYYERIGDLSRARRFYRLSLQERGDSARKYAGLTRVYLALGEADSAEATARLHDGSAQTPEEIPLLPQVQLARRQYTEAIHTARRSAAQQAARENLTGAANGYMQTATLAFAAGRLAESERAAAEAVRLARRVNDPQSLVRALTLLAASQSEAGRQTSSAHTFNELMPLAKKLGEPLLQAEAYSALGQARARSQDFARSLTAFDSAVAIRRRVADRFADSFDQIRFAAPFAAAFDRTLARVAKSGEPARVHQWLQRRKQRGSAARAPRSLAELAASLQPNEAVIDYLVISNFVGGVVTTRDTAFVFTLKATREQLARLVERLRRPVAQHFGRIDFTRARFDYEAAHELYRQLLLPLEPTIGEKSRWFISPDDQLQLVPFDALVVSGAGPGAQLILDEHEVSYVVSAAAAGRLVPARIEGLTVVASDAPGSAAEIAAIRAHVPARVVTPATEANVRAALASSHVLHFAVHGEANVQHPLSSHLRVASGGGDDGYWHVSEIGKARTRAHLVVLTACETVHSRLFAGDGALSVARAFLNAGAHAVVATQWSVGAGAAEFSGRLYAHIAAGKSVAAAARTAKLELRRSGSDPLLWAPFVMIVSPH